MWLIYFFAVMIAACGSREVDSLGASASESSTGTADAGGTVTSGSSASGGEIGPTDGASGTTVDGLGTGGNTGAGGWETGAETTNGSTGESISVCGNGLLEAFGSVPEECDDGNLDPEDAALGDSVRLAQLPPEVAAAWLAALAATDLKAPGAEYVAEQARLLGLPTRMARSELHLVKSHQKVLELPGTGGQLAHHIVSSQRDVTLQDNFVLACSSWQELTLAGVVALDLGAPHTDFVVKLSDNDLRDAAHPLRQRSFDFVIGLHPDKGGLFRVEDQLAIWFPTAKFLLV